MKLNVSVIRCRSATALRLLLVVSVALIALGDAAFVRRSGPSAIADAATQHRVALSTGQARALSLLGKARPQKAVPLFLFTDPNKDPDDSVVLLATKYLQQQGFVDLRCVVTTLGDVGMRTKRAKFAKSLLDALGMERTPVGVGTDYDFEVYDASGASDAAAAERRRQDHQVFAETPLLNPRAAIETDGLALLERELQRVPDRSAVLLINSGMADPDAILRTSSDLVRRKTASVVIMGGVEPAVDRQGFVVADMRAYNNTTHQPSADRAYARLQELGIPLLVVNKEAAYAAAVSPSFYDSLAETGHPVGVFLKDQQILSLRQLWEGIHRGQLPPALTPAWFFNAFTDLDLATGAGKAALAQANAHVEDFEGLWRLVRRLNLYDVRALLAVSPNVGKLVFRPEAPAGTSADVRLVGPSAITNAAFLTDLITALGIESLNPSVPR
jgi:inosine-uridine nucleoside N-ribohydrolase